MSRYTQGYKLFSNLHVRDRKHAVIHNIVKHPQTFFFFKQLQSVLYRSVFPQIFIRSNKESCEEMF